MADKSTVLEHTIEDQLVAAVEAIGGKALKLRPPTGRGFPDRTCGLNERVAFVETKRPVGGVFARHQAAWFTDLEGAGLACFRVDNVDDISIVVEYLKQEN